MKTLQIPFHYFPDAVGGTEIYVWSLSRELRKLGVEVEIAAPGETAQQYIHDGVRVHRVGVTPAPEDVSQLYGAGDPVATEQFSRLLDLISPDLVHFHAMSPAVSHHVMREVKKRGIPAIFTCHIPGITCQRGTLLRNGKEVCDGAWELLKCTACTLQNKGLPTLLGRSIARLPNKLLAGAASKASGSPATALRMPALMEARHTGLAAFLSPADHIIAVSSWLADVLESNGVPPDKITMCRHGVTQEVHNRIVKEKDGQPIRFAYLGRLHPTKGPHIVVEALRRRPSLPVQLDLFSVVQDNSEYTRTFAIRIARDPRIRLLPPISNDQVVRELSAYDAVLVPSQTLETGPLVVYDAFSGGIPVIGSRRGGLLELVTHEMDGLLVEPADPEAWAAAIERFTNDATLRKELRAGIQPPRTMAGVTKEMLELYRRFVNCDAQHLTLENVLVPRSEAVSL